MYRWKNKYYLFQIVVFQSGILENGQDIEWEDTLWTLALKNFQPYTSLFISSELSLHTLQAKTVVYLLGYSKILMCE